jgi:hypothetical protein
MDNARQVVRWSIPGFVLTLELAVFAAVLRLTGGQDPLDLAEAANTTAAVLSLLAGVPLGFLLYQLYFRNYRPFGYSVLLVLRQPWVFPVEFLRGILTKQSWQHTKKRATQRYAFVRNDRGAAILDAYLDRGGRRELVAHVWPHDDPSYSDIKQSIEPVTDEHSGLGNFMRNSFVVLKLKEHRHAECDVSKDATICDECRNSYRERFVRHWSIVVSMLDFTCGFQNAGAIKNEYTSGSDIYHALGAARTGIVGAWYVALGYLLFVAHPTLSVWLLGIPFISILAFVQYKVLSSSRKQAFDHLVARVAAGLAWFSRTDWQARELRASPAGGT